MRAGFPRLYAIIDAGLVASGEPELAVLLARAGASLIQYRNKAAGARQIYEISSAIQRQLLGYDARLIVNDRVDIALLAGAGGVHLGQDDLPVAEVRKIITTGTARRGEFWVGISTHTIEQVKAADATSADYIAIGPIFATATKQAHEPTVGIDFVKQARELTEKPLVAIGGITAESAAAIYSAGADCVAVSRDLIGARDPAARVKGYLATEQSARASG
ncbi:MAG TPA: thiamine phosphate synthase [Candidatus Acidoferrales bacterium]|nr:thiamine phosphate synthase [Candidatus Acidoferrales bacterium]